MKRNIHLTALLLSLALFCAACGAQMPGGEEEPAEKDQTAPVIVTAPDQTGSFEPAPSVSNPVQFSESCSDGAAPAASGVHGGGGRGAAGFGGGL